VAAFDLAALPGEVLEFLAERHLATLTVLAPDGGPRVTPVGFTYDAATRVARVITWANSWKAKHLASAHDPRCAISSVDGGRWLTIYGAGQVASDAVSVDEGVRRYPRRYRQPKQRPDRVVIEVLVERIVGRV